MQCVFLALKGLYYIGLVPFMVRTHLAAKLMHIGMLCECYKVDVISAIIGEVQLPYPHEAADQWVVDDVVGGNTLWNERNLKAA